MIWILVIYIHGLNPSYNSIISNIRYKMIKSDQITSAGIFCASSSAVHAGGSERQVFRWREIRPADFL